MIIAELNKEEKLDLIITTLKSEIIEKAENIYRVKCINKDPKLEAIKILIDRTINLDYITDFELSGISLIHLGTSFTFSQKINIEMTVEGLLDNLIYETTMFYEPSIEIINEYLHKHCYCNATPKWSHLNIEPVFTDEEARSYADKLGKKRLSEDLAEYISKDETVLKAIIAAKDKNVSADTWNQILKLIEGVMV